MVVVLEKHKISKDFTKSVFHIANHQNVRI